MDLWAACGLKDAIHPIRGEFWRIVESQEQVATARLVDNLAEQGLLEELLEGAKPAPRPGSERLDYLLMTPFRYPPLRHGSRFGRAYEPSLLYGALAPATALAECAYYRFVFRAGMAEPPPGPINPATRCSAPATPPSRGCNYSSPPASASAPRSPTPPTTAPPRPWAAPCARPA